MDAQERPAEGNQVLGMTGVAADSQKAVLKAPALEVVLEKGPIQRLRWVGTVTLWLDAVRNGPFNRLDDLRYYRRTRNLARCENIAEGRHSR